MASADSDEIRNRTQQSPLASQRAKDEGKQKAGWFPLGAKEGFSQWVRQRENVDRVAALTKVLAVDKPLAHGHGT